VLKHGTRWTYRILIAALVAASALLGTVYGTVRFWLLPGIDSYRPEINQAITRAARQHIEIGRIEGELDGLRPRLTLHDVRVYDRAGVERLALGSVDSTLSWTSLLAGEPRFHSIDLRELSLEVRRDETGAWSVAGIALAGSGSDEGLVEWLLQQDGITLRDSQLIWIDERLSGLAFKLDRLDLSITKRFQRYRIEMTAVPPMDVASPLVLRAELQGESLQRPQGWRGSLYFEVGYADLAALRQWFELPMDVSRGAGGLQVSLELAQGQLREVAAEVGLSDVRARLRDDLPELELSRLQGRMRWKTLPRLTEFAAQRLTFVTPDGLRLAPSDIRYTRTGGKLEPGAHSEVVFSLLDLEAVSRLIDRLPVDEALRVRLAQMQLKGTLRDFSIGWDGQWDSRGSYRVQGSFEGIGSSATGYLPGFSSVTGKVELDQTRGSIDLRAAGTTLDMPRVFVEPLPLGSFDARLSWTMVNGLPRVQLEGVAFANPHLAGKLSGVYSAAGEGPGSIDVEGSLARVDGRDAWRYIPLVVHPNVRDWLQRSILAGNVSNGRFKLRGELRRFPWSDAQSGLLEVAGTVERAQIGYARGWPRVDAARADLLVRGHRMEINSRDARMLGMRLNAVTVAIPDLGSHDPLLELRGEAEGSTAEFLDFIDQSPVDGMIGGFTRGMRATGRGRLQMSMDLPLHRMGEVKLAGRYQFADNVLVPGAGMPRLEGLTGELSFDEKGVSMREASARIFASPARFTLERGESGGVRVRAGGRMDAAVLRQQLRHPLAASLTGSADWRATIDVRGQQYGMAVESDLLGMGCTLPAPFGKPAQTALALRVEKRERTADLDQVNVSVGNNLVSAQLLIDRVSSRVTRGEVSFGSAALAPQRDGVWVSGRLDRLDLNQWQRAWPAADRAAPAEEGWPLAGVKLKLAELDLGTRMLRELEVDGARRDTGWAWSVNGRDAAGTLGWAGSGDGRLVARLSRLYLPPSDAGMEPVGPGGRSRLRLPALDVAVDDFRLSERQFGRLTLAATPQGDDWRIDQLEMRSPEGTLAMSGLWQAGAPRPATQLNVKAEVSDIGRYFARLKLPPGVKGGAGHLEGRLGWDGPPFALDLPSLSGTLALDVKKGQFVRLEPGIAKLIGVISLQSIPRRVTLDFGDIFSEGFTFDRISATASVTRGVAHTGDFRMIGTAAKVDLKGDIDLAAETQQLDITVKPALSESIALGAAIVNPAVGLATLLAQKALRDPIEKMVAFEYRVSGTWADPVVTKKRRPAPEPGPSARR
jgi:uncharacterized protein (TIGR02099 family)